MGGCARIISNGRAGKPSTARGIHVLESTTISCRTYRTNETGILIVVVVVVAVAIAVFVGGLYSTIQQVSVYSIVQ